MWWKRSYKTIYSNNQNLGAPTGAHARQRFTNTVHPHNQQGCCRPEPITDKQLSGRGTQQPDPSPPGTTLLPGDPRLLTLDAGASEHVSASGRSLSARVLLYVQRRQMSFNEKTPATELSPGMATTVSGISQNCTEGGKDVEGLSGFSGGRGEGHFSSTHGRFCVFWFL